MSITKCRAGGIRGLVGHLHPPRVWHYVTETTPYHFLKGLLLLCAPHNFGLSETTPILCSQKISELPPALKCPFHAASLTYFMNYKIIDHR